MLLLATLPGFRRQDSFPEVRKRDQAWAAPVRQPGSSPWSPPEVRPSLRRVFRNPLSGILSVRLIHSSLIWNDRDQSVVKAKSHPMVSSIGWIFQTIGGTLWPASMAFASQFAGEGWCGFGEISFSLFPDPKAGHLLFREDVILAIRRRSRTGWAMLAAMMVRAPR